MIPQVDISAHKIKGHWEFAFKDNGIGIDEKLVKAFNESDPSHQPIESEAGTTNEKGTGLGLLLSKQFIALLGGTIRLESTPSEGSDFMITLTKG